MKPDVPKILNISCLDPILQDVLSRDLGISRILAQVLINRGFKTAAEAEKFLSAKLDDLLSYQLLPDIERAVDLVKCALGNRNNKVMIFGDYDTDGITGVALLKKTLSKMGMDVEHYLPHRIKEGYGLNKNVLSLIKQKGIKLLITVDCGTNNHLEIRQLRQEKIEVVVIDHHESADSDLPPASAIVNPKLKNSRYPYRDLAGVGVAYKFCQAVTGDKLFEDLDLVSLGTISDVVPLTGENRILVKEGLSALTRTKNVGLKALIETSGIEDKKMTPYFVSYILGPRINASGRIASAEIALELLLTGEELKARGLAEIIEAHNRQRQRIESVILQEAEDLISREINFKEHKVIVIAKDDWHPGVLGIVASKLTDRFYRPTILISKGHSLCKGSARSIKNFHLFEMLCKCRHLLESFGGHAHAAGLVISPKKIEDFKKLINHLAEEKLLFMDLLPSLDIDMELKLQELDKEVVMELEALAPFGLGNPEPLFFTRELRVKGEPRVLGRNTLKFWVTDGEFTYPAIGFNLGELKDNLINAKSLDLVYKPKMDLWEDNETIFLEVQEIFFR
ncbi:MAG: single-stranded-DNA-specific exonuclease RecJ [Candidatus Omnitrophica bacterium]|nr:single-stranded-DNA-specific exonuclease RecJ [Candidatus Omnitrophota bacterium]